jgi:hypothetical protein
MQWKAKAQPGEIRKVRSQQGDVQRSAIQQSEAQKVRSLQGEVKRAGSLIMLENSAPCIPDAQQAVKAAEQIAALQGEKTPQTISTAIKRG